MSIEIITKTGTVGVSPSGALVCALPVSTVITEWCYLSLSRVLCVTWNSKAYYYKDVPYQTVHAMMEAESLGAFLNAEVKPNYETIGS